MHRRLVTLALGVLVLAGLLAAGAGAAPAATKAPRSNAILVRALASGGWRALPVRGASVRVIAGDRVIARGRVGSQGIAVLRSRGERPAGFRVLVSGGRIGKHRFGGRLSATVVRYAWPRTVHVDCVTTLADRYRSAHPGTSPRRANRRTKRFLALSPSYVIGLDGRTSVGFDGRRFLAAAGTGRGYDRLVGRLVAQMRSPKAQHSFAPGRRPGAAGASAASLQTSTPGLKQVAAAIERGAGIFKVLEGSTSLGGFAKTVMGMLGNEKSSKLQSEIEQMKEQLQRVEQSLKIVEETVDDLKEEGRQFNYDNRAGEAAGFRHAASAGEDLLQSATALSVQHGCLTATPGPECATLPAMLTGPAGLVATMRENGLGNAAGVTRYAELVGGEALPESAPDFEGIVQAASDLITDGHSQAFFRAGESESLRAAGAFWVGSYAQAAALAASAWGLAGASEATLATDTALVSRFAAKIAGTLPDELPPTATIQMARGEMWPTMASGSGSSSQYSALAKQKWRYDSKRGTWIAKKKGGEIGLLQGAPGGKLPFSDWRLAANKSIVSLLEAVTPKPGQMSGEAVLEQSGISWRAVTPSYGGYDPGVGLEMEYIVAAESDVGCRGSKSTCYWPVWVGDGVVGNIHEVGDVYGYVNGTFRDHHWWAVKWDGEELWGYDNEGTIYGDAPPSVIPFLFHRKVGKSECYYYPAPGDPASGSPGCPGT